MAKRQRVPVYVPPTQRRQRKPLETMTPDEVLDYLYDVRTRLQAKQRREKAYLDRRAARGTDTPTDEAYRQDQILEDEILDFLNKLEQQFKKDMET